MTRQHPRLVAWKRPEDLQSVKHAFYPVGDSPDRRQWGLEKVRAWSVRMRLPHAIEATSMLTAAILHDVYTNPSLTRRLTYSTAICRFVNGLLDPAQQSQFALSMHTLARNLSLPASFVEVRHAATHEALPSLEVLRTVANRALEWLWAHYWAGVDNGEEGGKKEVEVERARFALKRWRRARRENPLREVNVADESEEGREAVMIVRECVGICSSEEGVEILVEAFLEEKVLVPAGRKKTPLMPGAFLLWTPLLEHLDSANQSFTLNLISSLLETIKSLPSSTFIPSSPPNVAANREFHLAIQHWLLQLTSPASKLSRSLDIPSLLESCIFTPNEATMKLLTHLLEHYPNMKQKYGAIAAMAEAQVPPSVPDGKSTEKRKRGIEDVEEELKDFEGRFEMMAAQRKEWDDRRRGEVAQNVGVKRNGKWRKWEGHWVIKPIGVV
ncbi:rRNA-processing protein las1 [Rhizina undulata]